MQQWVQTVSSLIKQHPEAEIKEGQLSGCTTFLVDGAEVRMTTVTSNRPQVPAVVGFSEQSTNACPNGLPNPKFAFLLRPAEGIGAHIQALKVASIFGNTATFERVGEEDWYLPNSSPRN